MNNSKTIKIVHVSSPLTWRGGEQQLYYLYLQLKDKGVGQKVYCPKGSILASKIDPEDSLLYSKRSGFDLMAAYKLSKNCRAYSPDIVHAHDAHAHTTSVLASAVWGNEVPIVLSRRVDFAPSSSLFTRFKYNYKRINTIVCVSKAIEDILRPAIHNKKIKLTTIHSGINLNRLEKPVPGKLKSDLNLPADCILIGNVSALADHKDYPTFLKTAALLRDIPNLHFVIIGSGSMEEELKYQTKELGLSNLVTFAGFRTDVDATMVDLDIFLFTSKTEGLGTAILDAFANKIPVVATNAGGVPEMVVDGETGLLCEVGDAESLSNAVKKLINSEELKQRVIRGALEKLQHFTAESTATKTLEEYRLIKDI